MVGTNWYEGMFHPDPKTGIISPSGRSAGGHAWLCNGVDTKRKLVRVHNSWGTGWGLGGDAFLSFGDLERLLGERGDACIPVIRTRA